MTRWIFLMFHNTIYEGRDPVHVVDISDLLASYGILDAVFDLEELCDLSLILPNTVLRVLSYTKMTVQ
jgi:hypothetical protein